LKKSTKICTKCKSEKDSHLFPARKKSKDGRASWCRACFKISWEKRYYENHQHYRNSHNTSRNRIREQNARNVFEYLAKHSCLNCGESDPIVLEFDHRNKDDKIENISNLILNSTWEKIQKEIEKCDVLCANYHRRKSAAEFNYKRHVFVNK
jgi:acetylornithine/succinyldiaminopimelate/putrescine aminotransferase